MANGALSTRSGANTQIKWSGLAMPVVKRSRGYFTPRSETDLLKSSVQMILGTRIGERVMNPEFGSRLFEIPLTEQVDAVTEALVQEYVTDAINRWEPRVRVDTISILSSPNSNEVHAKMKFRVVDNPDQSFSLNFALQGM